MVLAGTISQLNDSKIQVRFDDKYSTEFLGLGGGPLCNVYNPTIGLFFGTCLHTTSDDNQTRPQLTTQTLNKHHHHGGGAANLSGSLDLMNPRHLRGGRPYACSFQGHSQSDLIDSIN
jgi:hypothetical protein